MTLSTTARAVLSMPLVFGLATAFVLPAGRGGSWSLPNAQQRASSASSIGRTTAHRGTATSPVRMTTADADASSDVEATAAEKAAKLRASAAAFRAQAEALQDEREQQRRDWADRSFTKFDSNNDGVVGIAELRAGLEGPLKKTFAKQLSARMGRKPTAEEVDEKIAELPGGCLFPDDVARKLIGMYDQTGDGLLQQSEFATTEELRARLESMFREQREEQLEARAVQRKAEMGEKNKAEGKGAASMGDSNDADATAAEKALCALPYLLPMSDGIVYAQHLFTAYPQQVAWAEPIAGALLLFNNLPFVTLAMFFGMSILSRKPEINKLIRFNMLQAINFDIALITPAILGPITVWSLGQDAYKLDPLTNVGSDVLFFTLLAAVVYSVASSATGTFPNKLPLFGRLNRENPDREN